MLDRSRWTIPALLCLLAAAPAIVVALLGETMVMPPAPVYFGVVLAAAGITAGAAFALTLAGGLGIPIGTGLVFGLAAVALAHPAIVPKVPTAGSDAAYMLLACGLCFCVLLTHRATRTFWLTRRPADLLVAVGCVWLGVALVATLVIGPMTLGYYVGHALELAAGTRAG